MVQRISSEINIPFTVGGGIKSVAEIEELLKAGADKVSLNSSIVKDPELINKASEAFGAQAIVAAVDAKKTGSEWSVFIKGGTENTGKDALEWMREVEERGAGEILLTSMDRDGTKNGFDLELLSKVDACVNIPVIASGGAGTIQHCIDVVKISNVDAVLAASIFHFKEIEISELKRAMKAEGIPMRLNFA